MTSKNIAFLGPAGTNSELALKQYLNPTTTTPCVSIKEIFELVLDGKVSSGFVPIENKLQGPVTETLDLLLLYRHQIYLDQTYLMQINNSLGMLPRKTKTTQANWQNEITSVYSHTQALHQCSEYLRKHLPQALQQVAQSTVAAMQLVKTREILTAAVVGPKQTLLDQGYEVIAENISNKTDNQTRFALIKAGDIDQILKTNLNQSLAPELSRDYVTSIVIVPGRDRQGLLFEILDVISLRSKINLLSIHSRPDTKGGFVFYLDLEGHLNDKKISACLSALKEYSVTATKETVEIVVFGSSKRQSFNQTLFSRVCIIGGEGMMGKWFARFFEAAGIEVLSYDKSTATPSNLTLDQLIPESDIILLSTPMSAIQGIAKELSTKLKPGTLIVENCSIKNSSLPYLIQYLKPEHELLGIHTMFGDNVESIKGENVIVTPTTLSREKAKAFEDLLYKHGAKITHASIEEHDTNAAIVINLVHLALLSFAETVSDLVDSPKTLETFATPNSRRLINSIHRILIQSDLLLTDVQTFNANASKARKLYLETTQKLLSAAEKGDSQALLASANKSRAFFKLNS